MNNQDCTKQTPITDDMVAAYLRDHQDFFEHHADVLTTLAIFDNNGSGTISLIEKQVSVLREQNKRYHQQINTLIDIARDNETLVQRMHELVLALLKTVHLEPLFQLVGSHFKDNFDADCTTIRLFAAPQRADLADLKEFVGEQAGAQQHFQALIEQQLPLSGSIETKQRDFLFEAQANKVQSAVLVPLYGEHWQGVLAIGSFDANRFHAKMGIELLKNFGELLSCLLTRWIKVTE